jgi:RNA polymerase sigma factor (sigma-70 family)
VAHRASGGNDDLVRQYLDEIGRHPLLNAAEEVALAKTLARGRDAATRLTSGARCTAEQRRTLHADIAAGDEAKRRFIQANLRLVVSVARRYEWCGAPLLDLVQEGNVGLMRAVDKFDHTKGFKFSTYATWWIRQAIGRSLGDVSRPIRLPAHVRESFTLVDQSTARLTRQLGRVPTPDEIAGDTGLSAERVSLVRQHRGQVLSLSAHVSPDTDTELHETIAADDTDNPYEAAAAALEREALRAQLRLLEPREQAVLARRFGLDDDYEATLAEIGDEYELTRERIRQIVAKALSKLRHPSLRQRWHAPVG